MGMKPVFDPNPNPDADPNPNPKLNRNASGTHHHSHVPEREPQSGPSPDPDPDHGPDPKSSSNELSLRMPEDMVEAREKQVMISGAQWHNHNPYCIHLGQVIISGAQFVVLLWLGGYGDGGVVACWGDGVLVLRLGIDI